MATDILVENNFLKKKNERNPVCETKVWPLVDRVKNLIEKKWPGLSDSGMASGGLEDFEETWFNTKKILMFLKSEILEKFLMKYLGNNIGNLWGNFWKAFSKSRVKFYQN